MEISNHSDSDIKLLSANTKGYKRLELHKTVSQDGMMKMIKQDFMPIPAHGKLTLKHLLYKKNAATTAIATMTIKVFFNILMLMVHHFFMIHRPAFSYLNATLPVHEAQHDRATISVDNPWAPSPPPNAPLLIAVMEISNHSDSDIKLLSANTKGYKRLELHKTVSTKENDGSGLFGL
jgi:copper(I)-binding protein